MNEGIPLNVEFAASCLDGAMEDEHPEIRKWWSTVRWYLVGMGANLPAPKSPAKAEE